MTTTPVQVPSQLSEEEARRFLETHTPRFNKLREVAVASQTRVEEARKKITELLAQAEKTFGTTDEAEIARRHEEARMNNGAAALKWIRGVEACEEASTHMRTAQPGR